MPIDITLKPNSQIAAVPNGAPRFELNLLQG